MKFLVEHFLKHPIWANVSMLAILLFGFFSATQMRTSFFPESDPNRVVVSVVYPGTSPEEIEKSLITPIEQNIEGITGVDYTKSTSRENFATITVIGEDNCDIDEVYEDVKNAVNQVTPWPTGAESPTVIKTQHSMPGIVVAITGDTDLWPLKKRAEELEDELLNSNSISDVSVVGYPDREIAIEISEENLKRYNLTFSQISQAVKSNNVDISGGKVETEKEELLIRAYQKEASVSHIRNIPVKTLDDGTIVVVGDVANVVEQWSDTPSKSTVDGEQAIWMIVNQTEGEDLLTVADEAIEITENFQKKHPDLNVRVVFDSTISLRDRIRMLLDNGKIGLLLVLLTLTLFLNFRVGFWVALGIPISFAGMFIVANMAGITINVLSLMGMIVVLGILVDDAIVVAEQIFQGVDKGMSPSKAARWGVMKVMAPVFTAVLTTILAFVPFFFFAGQLGNMIGELALVVVAALIFSLFESFFILPAHLAHSKGIKTKNPGKLRRAVDKFYEWLSFKVYGKALHFVMHNKITTVIGAIGALVITVGMFQGGIIKSNPFPELDADSIKINVALTAGTQESITDSIMIELEKRAWQYDSEVIKKKYNKSYFKSSRITIGSNDLGDNGSHAATIEMDLIDAGDREITSNDMIKIFRKYLKGFSEVQKMSFSEGHWGKPISINISSNDLDALYGAKEFTKEQLGKISLVKDVIDSDVEGGNELYMDLKPSALALGLTHSTIAMQIREAFYGTEIQRIQRGKDEIKIWVRYVEEDRSSIGKLEKMMIKTPTGKQIPLIELVNFENARGLAVIKHEDGRRNVKVEADLASTKVSSSEVTSLISLEVFPKVKAKFPNVKMELSGQNRSNKKFTSSLINNYVPAFIGIIIILVLVFNSFLQSSIIIMMIPLGLAGAIWGHLIHGIMISRMSSFGLIALTGIVINDSIVFIDQINHNLKNGMKVYDAVYDAGISRLRPILMTTITTVAGLAPLIMETSFQAQMVIPMAISVAWGMAFGCIFILLLVPSYFLTLNNARFYFARLKRWILVEVYDQTDIEIPTRENVEPAYMIEHQFDEEGENHV